MKEITDQMVENVRASHRNMIEYMVYTHHNDHAAGLAMLTRIEAKGILDLVHTLACHFEGTLRYVAYRDDTTVEELLQHSALVAEMMTADELKGLRKRFGSNEEPEGG